MKTERRKMSIEQFEEIASQHINNLTISHYILTKDNIEYEVSRFRNPNSIYVMDMLEVNNYVNIIIDKVVYCISKYELHNRHLEFIRFMYDYIVIDFKHNRILGLLRGNDTEDYI